MITQISLRDYTDLRGFQGDEQTTIRRRNIQINPNQTEFREWMPLRR